MNTQFFDSGFFLPDASEIQFQSSSPSEVGKSKLSVSPSYWVGWGTPKRCERPELLEKSSRDSGSAGLWVYAPDFFLSDGKPWWKFPEVRKFSLQTLYEELELTEEESEQGSSLEFSALDSDFFHNTFNRIQDLIQKKSIEKMVPVYFRQSFLASRSIFMRQRLSKWIRSSISKTKGFPQFPYGFWSGSEGILGATPELLFSIKKGKFQTMALAGTKKNPMPEGALLSDPKEVKEHQIVVNCLLETLQKTDPNLVLTRGRIQEWSLPALTHLMTSLEGTLSRSYLDESEFIRWVEALHPTPALGASPRESAFSFLKKQDELRGHSRMRFGAPIGLWSSEFASTWVAIRNLQWKDESLYLGAGGGIVDQSQVEREWKEIHLKMDSVAQFFSIEKEVYSE